MTKAQHVVEHIPETVGYMPVSSYLWHFINDRPIKLKLVTASGEETGQVISVPAWAVQGEQRLYKVGLDLGNNGPKAAMYDEQGRTVVAHLQAVVKTVQDLAAGDMGTVFEEMIQQPKARDQKEMPQRGDAQAEVEDISLGREWVDSLAIEHDGVSLSKGTTRARVSDPRYPRFLMYAVAHLFQKAGYKPGDYDLLLAVGMPNEEMVETAHGAQLDPETQAALTGALCGKRWRIRITDREGTSAQFNLKIADLAPGPQSYAAFYAWQFKPDGQPAQTDIQEITLEDMGANDLHELFIRLKFIPSTVNGKEQFKVTITATRERKGDGIILAIMQPFAKRLKKVYGLGELDDAVAQQAFFQKEITVGGFREDLSPLVASVTSEEGAKVITDVFKGPRRPRSFYMIEGGGNVLLRPDLVDKLTSLNRTARTYLLFGAQHANVANAVGLLSILDQVTRYGHV